MRGKHPRGVLLVSRIFQPEPAAAAFRLGAVVDHLEGARVPVHVLTTRFGRHQQHGPRVSVSRFPVLRDKKGYVRGYLPYMSFDVPLFFRMLLAPKPDVVLVEPPPTTGFVARLACALRRVPYVWYAADIWSDAAASTGANPLVVAGVRRLEKFALRGATSVIAVSAGVAQRARDLGGTDVRIVPNGTDTAVYTPAVAPPAEAELSDLGISRPYFLYAGTASEWQDAEEFARAFVADKQLSEQFQLVYVGGGSRWLELERIQAKTGDALVLLAARQPAEVARLLRGARAALVSVAPGKNYDFAYPTKVLAALACGVPVLYAGPGQAGVDVTAGGFGISCPLTPADLARELPRIASFDWDEDRARSAREWTVRNRSLVSVGEQVSEILTESLTPTNRSLLVILTAQYPADRGDTPFLQLEVEKLAQRFDRVVILSREEAEVQVPLPQNVTYAGTFGVPRRTLLRQLLRPRTWWKMGRAFGAELRSGRRRGQPVRVIGEILAGVKFAGAIQDLALPGERVSVYSFWGVGGAQALPFLPARFKKTVRLHGGDLYEESPHLPLRVPIFAAADRILLVSEHGKNYLKEAYPHLRHDPRVQVARLGTTAAITAKPPTSINPIRVVSCSTVNENKRVDAILAAVALLADTHPVRWTHLGGGELLPELHRMADAARAAHSQLQVDLRGHVSNRDVLDYYQTNPTHVFVNASDSEGVPVSIMEALSAGIPVVATDVGGTGELVGAELGSGVLLRKCPPANLLAETIRDVATNRSDYDPQAAWRELADGSRWARRVARTIRFPRGRG